MASSCEESEAPIHLLLTCVAAAGHINPLVQLAYYLIEPRPWKPVVYITLAILTNSNIQGKVHIPEDKRIRVITQPQMELNSWVERAVLASQETADQLTPRVSQKHLHWPPVDAVVFDFVSTFGQTIAETLKVPSYAYMASPLFFFWSMVKYEVVYGLHDTENPPKHYTIPGIGDFTLLPRPTEDPSHAINNLFGQMAKICLDAYLKADGCLANDIQSFYSPEFLNSLPPTPLPKSWQVLCCGPLAVRDPRCSHEVNEKEADEVSAFASRFPPRSLLYIALGSCWSLKNQDLVELVRGVAATGRPFIFAHRGRNEDDPFESLLPEDTPATEATEEDGLPVNFREEVKDRGLIVKWVNQPRLLSHRSVGAFMTHCGWNSILEGMAFGGVPYLLLPIGGDQQANAEFLSSHLRCGKLVRGIGQDEVLDRDKVREVIDATFRDDEMRERASQLHKVARQDSAENGVADSNAMKFFNMLLKK